jgi:hypothetical protein
MKRIIVIAVLILSPGLLFAKKVKFAVDMTRQIISVNGVHVVGDFQIDAGFSGGNWNSTSCLMTKEGSSYIYSITVDLPAFRKYEYKFMNGDQFYEAEFLPLKSRVGYDFSDNRWIYIDSLINDTFYTQPILFGGNAPAGKKLLRVSVNMKNETIASKGVHVSGSFNGDNFGSHILCNLFDHFYEAILFVDSMVYNFRYVNGNTSGGLETVPMPCATMGARQAVVYQDTVMPTYCFSTCDICNTAGIVEEKDLNSQLNAFPNPSGNSFVVSFGENLQNAGLKVYNALGGLIYEQIISGSGVVFDASDWSNGIYYLSIGANGHANRNLKLQKI